jgi:predicted acyl esterase
MTGSRSPDNSAGRGRNSPNVPNAGADPGVRSDPGGVPGGYGVASGTPAAKPASGNGVSRPGEYSGYSEVLYDGYAMTSQYVAVRDATQLAIDLFRPTAAGRVIEDPLPVVWMHTPYNRRNFTSGLTAASYPGQALELVKYGYVVAVADFRGLYASYGKNAAYNRGEWMDAARFDAYDITEWLAAQPWSSGKIAMWGCSATGGSQLQAATTAPPHLRAIFPMSCEFDAYPFGVPGGMAPPEGTPTRVPPGGGTPESRDAAAVPVDGDSGRSLVSAAVAEHRDNIENAGYVPFRDSNSAALGVPWWIHSSPHTYLQTINESGIAIYAAANWDEAATKYGAFFTFNNVRTPRKLIIGPQTHCLWSAVKRDQGFDIVIEELRFFDYWLKGVENGVMYEPPITYYTYHAQQGPEWRSASAWPLPNERRTKYFFGAQSLGTEAPAEEGASDKTTVNYSSTPENRASTGLTYATAPLEQDIEVTGHPVVNLWVSSSAGDGDFIANLEDVGPDGTVTSYNIEGRLRASLRKLDSSPYDNLGLPWHRYQEADVTPLVGGEPTELAFDLYPISFVFKAGHRIRLVLTFADSRATPTGSPAPELTIHRDPAHSSSITLPIIPR